MVELMVFELVLYFIILLAISFFYKRSKNLKDFSISGSKLLTPAIITGLVMTHYGGGFILGGAELGYAHGMYGLVYAASAAIGVFLLGMLISKKVFTSNKKKDLRTIPSLLFQSFKDRKISILAAGLSVISLVAIAAAQLFAIMCLLSVLKLPSIALALIITLIISIITSKGLNAVIRMSKLNIVIVSIAVLIVFIIAINSNLSSETASAGSTPLSVLELLGISLPVVLYTLIGQDFHQKLFSAKDHKAARRGSIIAAIILLVAGVFPVYIGMKSSSLFSVMPSEAMPAFIIFSVPLVIKGFIIAAILTAVIGSTQAVISAAASHIAEDFLKPSKKFSEKETRKYAIAFAFFSPFVAFLIALLAKGIIGILVLAYTLYTAGMFVPVIASFYLKKTHNLGSKIFYIGLIGLITALIFELHVIKTNIPSVAFSVLLSTAVLFVVTRRKSHRKNL